MTSDKNPESYEQAKDAFAESLKEMEDYKAPELEEDIESDKAIDDLPYLDESAKRLAKLENRANKDIAPRNSDEAIAQYDRDDEEEGDAEAPAEEVAYDDDDNKLYDNFSNKVEKLERSSSDQYIQDIETKYSQAYNQLAAQEAELTKLRSEAQAREDEQDNEHENNLMLAIKRARLEEDYDAEIRLYGALTDAKALKHTKAFIRAQQSLAPQPQYAPPPPPVPQQQPYYPNQQYQQPYQQQPQYAPPSPRERPKVAAPRSVAPVRRREAIPQIDRNTRAMLDSMPMKNPDGSDMSMRQKEAHHMKYGDR